MIDMFLCIMVVRDKDDMLFITVRFHIVAFKNIVVYDRIAGILCM